MKRVALKSTRRKILLSLPSSLYPKIPKKNFTGIYTEVNPQVYFFSNEIFEKLRKSLGVEKKTSTQNNVGLKPEKADVISALIENDLWKSNILESDNPETLLRTTFYLIGLNFGMKAGDEHRKLGAKFAKLANSFMCDYHV